MKNAVIIGAGQTGRGLIAPILKLANIHMTFIDKNKALIDELVGKSEFCVRYYSHLHDDVDINSYNAFDIESTDAVNAVAGADVLFTAVFAQNIKALIPFLKKSIEIRTKPDRLIIICCENGINVKQPLIDENINAVISEGIVFCTSVAEKDNLNIDSEAILDIPVDNVAGIGGLDISGINIVDGYSSLIRRKIHTYNYISALISYLGSYKNYSIYADAANDPDISYALAQVEPILNRVIAKEYKISEMKASEFSARAISKFKNKEIYDTILRNARQCERKLGLNERMISPLIFAIKFNESTKYFDIPIAAAIYYGEKNEGLCSKDIIELISGWIKSDKDIISIQKYYSMFKEGIALDIILSNNN